MEFRIYLIGILQFATLHIKTLEFGILKIEISDII